MSVDWKARMVIYFVRNIVNNKYYVGKTKNSLKDRWASHLSDARRGGKQLLQKAIRKYGESSFELDILSFCKSEEELSETEVLWIIVLDACNPSHGYNQGYRTLGGYGRRSAEERALIGRKISAKLKGRAQSEEHRKKNAEGHRGLNNPNKGLTLIEIFGSEKAEVLIKKNKESHKNFVFPTDALWEAKRRSGVERAKSEGQYSRHTRASWLTTREKRVAGLKKAWTPEKRSKRSIQCKARATPELKALLSQKAKEFWAKRKEALNCRP